MENIRQRIALTRSICRDNDWVRVDCSDLLKLCDEIEAVVEENERMKAGITVMAQTIGEQHAKLLSLQSWQESATRWIRGNADHASGCTGFMAELTDDDEVDLPCTCGLRELIPDFDQDSPQPTVDTLVSPSPVRCGFCHSQLTNGGGITIQRTCCDAGRNFDASSEHPDGPLPPLGGERSLTPEQEARGISNLFDAVIESQRLQKLTNEQLVDECANSEVADYELGCELMNRVHPGWFNKEPEKLGGSES